LLQFCYFFFSSRRRHTRSTRDWSSDVCSSDLDLRDDDHPRVVVGVDRLVTLLGLGPEGDGGARHVAVLRRLPPRAKPEVVGRPRSEERRVGKEWSDAWSVEGEEQKLS